MLERKAVICAEVAALLLLAGIHAAGAQTEAESGRPGAVSRVDVRRTVADGVFSKSQAERGSKIYAIKCASCHMANLGGSNTAASLVGESFVKAWEGKTLRDIFSRLRTTMPASDPGTLEEDETVDLIAFVLSRNAYPAGNRDLKGNRTVLQSIDIVRPAILGRAQTKPL